MYIIRSRYRRNSDFKSSGLSPRLKEDTTKIRSTIEGEGSSFIPARSIEAGAIFCCSGGIARSPSDPNFLNTVNGMKPGTLALNAVCPQETVHVLSGMAPQNPIDVQNDKHLKDE